VESGTGTLMRTLNGHVDDVTLLQPTKRAFEAASGSRQDYQALGNCITGQGSVRSRIQIGWKSKLFSPDEQTLASMGICND